MSHPDFTDEELLALLRDGTVTPEAIASEMQDAGVTPLPVEALVEARTLLADLAAAESTVAAALPADLRRVLVDAAIEAKAAPLLVALAAHKDKAVSKEGKRALHALKSRGIAVEAPKVEKPRPIIAAPPPDPEHQPSAWMSLPDGFGERVLFLSMPTRGGVDVAEVVVSDEAGVMGARLAQLSRKDFRKFVAALPKTGRLCMAEAPRPYVRALVSAALTQNDRAGKPVPPEFNEVAFTLGPTSPKSPSPGRALPLPENATDLAARSDELLRTDEFKGWLPAESSVRALATKLDEIDASTLYVDEQQKDRARQQALDDAVRAYWIAERRRQAAERLFDAGFLLDRAGRSDLATRTLATAAALDDAARPIEAIPFCRAVFEKLLGYLRGNEKAPAPAVSSSGLILP